MQAIAIIEGCKARGAPTEKTQATGHEQQEILTWIKKQTDLPHFLFFYLLLTNAFAPTNNRFLPKQTGQYYGTVDYAGNNKPFQPLSSVAGLAPLSIKASTISSNAAATDMAPNSAMAASLFS